MSAADVILGKYRLTPELRERLRTSVLDFASKRGIEEFELKRLAAELEALVEEGPPVPKPAAVTMFDLDNRVLRTTITIPGGTLTAEQAAEILTGEREDRTEELCAAFWLAHGRPILVGRNEASMMCSFCKLDLESSGGPIDLEYAKTRARGFAAHTDLKPEAAMVAVGTFDGTLAVRFMPKPEDW
jgi:hypothetical protein